MSDLEYVEIGVGGPLSGLWDRESERLLLRVSSGSSHSSRRAIELDLWNSGLSGGLSRGLRGRPRARARLCRRGMSIWLPETRENITRPRQRRSSTDWMIDMRF